MNTIKGSLQISNHDREGVADELSALISQMMTVNGVRPSMIQSLLLCGSDDLPENYVDLVIRDAGLDDVPVYCLQQFRHQSDLNHCVQVLMYLNVEIEELTHFVLGCETWEADWSQL